jgi:hypothetical protein
MLLSVSDVRYLSLDFELGYGQPNGLEVVRGIIVSGKYPKEVFVHSSSPMGRAQMVAELRAANPPGVTIHDGPITSSLLEAIASGDSGHA